MYRKCHYCRNMPYALLPVPILFRTFACVRHIGNAFADGKKLK